MANLQNFHTYKKTILEKEFSQLNEPQREAVFSVEGPLLILAGAGSGKTTVLIQRIAYLLKYGNAYHTEQVLDNEEILAFLKQAAENGLDSENEEVFRRMIAVHPPQPWSVMAITFTNKAANELKERLERFVPGGGSVLAATFHSVCVRILRRDIDRLGYSKNFTIYDTDDSLRVVKQILAELKLEEKSFEPKKIRNIISSAKNDNTTSADYAASAGTDYFKKVVATVFAEYQKRLVASSAVDFDDILLLAVQLLKENQDILSYYNHRYQYLLVDEYQDTNMVQFELVNLLAGPACNLCVVGDDDQSIYKFRGATIENILSFERHFPGAKVIRLEQNYRSTGTILECANAVISKNKGRKGKTLWTSSGEGEKITLRKCEDEQSECEYVAQTIKNCVKDGKHYSDIAVLYRVNALSNQLERSLVRKGIPYRIFGGHRFYDRKEIKDMLAYLSVINNPMDDLRLTRIINEPKRGIGDSTIQIITQLASELGVGMLEIICRSDEFAALSKRNEVLKSFAFLITSLQHKLDSGISIAEVYTELLNRSGYLQMLRDGGIPEETRIENINELLSNIKKYEETTPEPTLDGFLEDAALMSEMDNYDAASDAVVLMTVHGAKGLEFDTVFVIAFEEQIFPGRQSTFYPEELEEERRLAYVAFTRAKKKLIITHAKSRMLFGSTAKNQLSRFAADIPPELLDTISAPQEKAAFVPAQSFTLPKRPLSQPTGYKPVQKTSQTFSSGMRVKHAKFGDGTVLSSAPMGADMLLEIAFDEAGTKKLMANFAGLKIL